MSKDELIDHKKRHHHEDGAEKKVKKAKKHEHKHKHHHHHDKDEKSEKSPKKETTVPKVESKTTESVPVASASDVAAFMKDNAVSVEDSKKRDIKPLLTMKSLKTTGLDPRIEKVIERFDKPTPIQAVSWPYLFNGSDVVAVAETGSGKTLGFGIPAMDHVVKSGSRKLQVLVVSPTRELATQTFDNMEQLAAAVDMSCVCIYGGVPKEKQRKDVKKSQCVVATPGRLLDLIQEGYVDLSHVDYLVLDEADRMLEKGFEEDIKKIIAETKSQRQTAMFTATWPKEVRDLASSFLKDSVKVSIGDRDELTANKRIKQIVEVVEPTDKRNKLVQLLKHYLSGSKKNDKILIFALYKKEAVRVERDLKYHGYEVAALHGDLSQQQRTDALESFKSGECNLMLATDVAARGLDIPNVKVVINLTFPLTAEDYVHRIGRTGRAGQTGTAHTLFTKEEKHLAGALMNVLRAADQPVPEELLQFGSYTKKKTHGAYGAFFKDVDMSKKGKKITFD